MVHPPTERRASECTVLQGMYKQGIGLLFDHVDRNSMHDEQGRTDQLEGIKLVNYLS